MIALLLTVLAFIPMSKNIYDGSIEELRIMIARIHNENFAYIRCPDKDQLQVILSKELYV